MIQKKLRMVFLIQIKKTFTNQSKYDIKVIALMLNIIIPYGLLQCFYPSFDSSWTQLSNYIYTLFCLKVSLL